MGDLDRGVLVVGSHVQECGVTAALHESLWRRSDDGLKGARGMAKTLRDHTVGVGVFLILVARAPTAVWKVSRTRAGVIRNLDKTRQLVNHYSFHIMDPSFGHMTIKMSGHPPLRGAGDPQRPRVRRLPGTGGRRRLHEGGQLLHPDR